MVFLLATANPHKLEELRDILSDLPISLVSLADYSEVELPAEDAPTMAGNALLKARAAHAATGLPTLADDSGLEVDALDGAPGVQSNRWLGDTATVADKYREILRRLSDTPQSSRGARFRCAAALVWRDAHGVVHEVVTEGVCEGFINEAPRGDSGFGYDPVFFLPQHHCTMAELSAEQKNAISHRGRAFQQMKTHLRELIKDDTTAASSHREG